MYIFFAYWSLTLFPFTSVKNVSLEYYRLYNFPSFFVSSFIEDQYYVSIISDCFLVRSVTIHHILQSNEKRNIFGSIWHVSCFHLERYYKMIKIVYYVIHINFPIKSIDSCWLLKRGQHEIYRKIYWITKYSKKVWLEKN